MQRSLGRRVTSRVTKYSVTRGMYFSVSVLKKKAGQQQRTHHTFFVSSGKQVDFDPYLNCVASSIKRQARLPSPSVFQLFILQRNYGILTILLQNKVGQSSFQP